MKMHSLLLISLTGLPGIAVSIAGAAETKPITVTREEDSQPPPDSGWVMAQHYAARGGVEMLRADKTQMLRSADHGQTWGNAEPIAPSEPVGPGLTRDTSIACFYVDPENGLLVRFLTDIVTKHGGEIPYANAVGYGPHTMRIFTQVSRDHGRTWEPRQQLIETGAQYDSEHWARDVWYGRSGLCVEGQQPEKLRNGTVVLPAYLWPTADFMTARFEAQAWPANLRQDAQYFLESRCLLLRWKPDLSGFEFSSGGQMVVDGGYTYAGTCGSDEPAIAYLDDQRWLAIVRTSTSQVDDFRQRGIAMPRTCLLTTDGGVTWQTSEPLLFTDGGRVYSSSAWSQFCRSPKTGTWYWIGNVLTEPTYGTCDPRYPLQIVALDDATLQLRRETLTVIQDKEPGDDKWVRFSNFRTYEERGTRDLILLMTKSYCEFAPAGLPTPAYRYRIRWP
jgi:hypothetical protein